MNLRRCESPGDIARIAALSADQAPTAIIGCPHMTMPAALRNRGGRTGLFSEEALAGWRAQPRKTPGGQAHYSGLAIETALTLRAVFKLALRQSEGLIDSNGPLSCQWEQTLWAGSKNAALKS